MSTIEKILDEANQLGHLIRETGIYKKFETAEQDFERDKEAKELLSRYEETGMLLEQRQKAGDIIENYEFEEIRELTEQIQGNSLIMDYLAAKDEYISLLSRIQQAIGADDGT